MLARSYVMRPEGPQRDGETVRRKELPELRSFSAAGGGLRQEDDKRVAGNDNFGKRAR